MICLDACSRLIAEVASTNQEIVTTNLHIYPLPRFLFNFFQTLIFVYGDNIYGDSCTVTLILELQNTPVLGSL
jgi:hypothetical protein